MTKIAYIGPSGVFGGVRALVEHCNGLTRRGHSVTYLVTDGGPITWLPCYFEQRPLSDPGAGADVYVGSAIGTWPAALDLARKHDARSSALMQMAEWLFFPKQSPQYADMMRAFTTPLDSVMAISEWLAKLAEQVPDRRVSRVSTGIDTRLFYRQPMPGAPAFDGVTIVTEGYSNNPAKDVDEMTLRALRRLRYDDGVPVRVLGFSQFAQSAEVYDRFWTQPPQHVIRQIYSLGDIFLKASRYEGRPGPDLEAMACGTAVCRAILAGDDDLIDGHNCLKAPYGYFDAFYANLRRLIDDAQLRATLAANGLEYARNHTWEASLDAVEETLTGAVSKPREAAQAPEQAYRYDLAAYNEMQGVIVGWETPQAMWLGQTLADMLHPKSVVDIGCGPGIYLVPFKPTARVWGVDGAPEAGQALEPHEFLCVDFRDRPEFGRPSDLALCIEVAEHLPPDMADWLVRELTLSAPVVFFSAAQPGQGGTLHLNEQPKEYWIEKFRARGFDLHPLNEKLCAAIAANPHCQRVQWLIGNAMLLERRP